MTGRINTTATTEELIKEEALLYYIGSGEKEINEKMIVKQYLSICLNG